ncbi:thymidine kinase domain containing protein [Entamoeba histolytica HM-1:IMSS-B]|uniref:Thymidine kinase n=7 Tax=Entamoeba histolytica TaxID=5759 RepID=A0A8U0WPR2_ENTH1|nr:thymidine kinase, putative [Entamoeba histolytica HM-1:IMSS]AAS47703.1 thymidine kinase [Entamoeba histolytica]EMD46875.1 thymidine kinase, putative [Entamoeba histolytica KU27]EMH75746.1 thymidine kinase domain containing protein [Entamoeba histolytica HM-1:IMSS-B]EMS17556.1 thymidine kinase [Entamoeba histolytica HM-3:IMSS]ENY65154.1 thymidine kinase, putative [Entamoeba histolytica HM-1:IMSS-A]|eukprot:XP_655924.1 thymidine kinase, putative [Entamoeba histolytica HM-1:IMSS]
MNESISVSTAPVTPQNELEKTYDGSIQLIIGPMFSGKTTELIRLIKRFRYSKKTTVVIKYSKDTRYGSEDEAISHDKESWKAIPTMKLMPVLETALNYEVIGIDEGQFFPDLIEFSEACASYGRLVIIAALDGTFQRKPFGQITDLIPLCESVKKLSAVCVNCGKKAAFSLRTSSEESIEVIGGVDKYCAVCRKCFYKDGATLKTQRSVEFASHISEL